MNNWNNVSLLELVELYASDNNMIDSEESLSELFDNDIMPMILEEHGKPGVEFDDTCMVNEAFNDWTDMLCKDGQLHPEQYNQYCYVGDWS